MPSSRTRETLEAINTIFRGFHTIKGLAGFLDFAAIQRFAHEVETLLDLARNSKVAVDSGLIDVILQSADHMTQCLLGVETGKEPASNVEPLIARIRKMIGGDGDAPPADLAQLAAAWWPSRLAPLSPRRRRPADPAPSKWTPASSTTWSRWWASW